MTDKNLQHAQSVEVLSSVKTGVVCDELSNVGKQHEPLCYVYRTVYLQLWQSYIVSMKTTALFIIYMFATQYSHLIVNMKTVVSICNHKMRANNFIAQASLTFTDMEEVYMYMFVYAHVFLR